VVKYTTGLLVLLRKLDIELFYLLKQVRAVSIKVFGCLADIIIVFFEIELDELLFISLNHFCHREMPFS